MTKLSVDVLLCSILFLPCIQVKFSETNNRQFYFELKPAGDVNENHRIESTMVNLVSLPIPKLTRSDEVEGEVLRNQDKVIVVLGNDLSMPVIIFSCQSLYVGVHNRREESDNASQSFT